MSPALYVLLAVLMFTAPPSHAGDPKTETAPIIGGPVAPADPSKKVVWDDPSHKLFFNYQRYLLRLKLNPQTEDTWDALVAPEQAKMLKETEEFLKGKLAKVMASDWVRTDDMTLIKEVWGEEVGAAVERVTVAHSNGDPSQIEQATAQAAALAKSVGGVKADWKALFDGQKSGSELDLPGSASKADTKDYLAVEKKSDFMASLSSAETARVLATQKSYASFLREKGVADAAMPGMLAMYQVLNGAPTASSREMEHLLPTVVAFLNDGKRVSFNPKGPEGALGMATPGDYDRPEAVEVTPSVIGADPVVVGKTLAHEFQHIYDMYTGRYYTLDSEMRGFKVAALYFKTLKERNPEKYEALRKSDDDETRGILRDVESYTRDFESSPVAFREAVSTRYQSRDQGVFMGRMSLRESVDPRLESGGVVDLATERSRLEVDKREVASLEAEQARANKTYLSNTASRDAARELEKITKDLASARRRRDGSDREVTIKQIRLKRMESEVAWMDKIAAEKGRQPDAHDLTLAVDRSYIPQ